MINAYDDLKWRGLVNQVSNEKGVRAYLAKPGAYAYCGFDPTAVSLHVGNLVPLLSLVRMRLAGHNPIFLLGGATGLIGDPSGKDVERELATVEKVHAQAARIKAQADAFFERNTGEPAEVVNNYEWTVNMSAIELLRDVGKHFTINWMMGKESVKGRISREEVGISYTEFSYMILQALDFHYLYEKYGLRLQIGGGDQWGNITAGCELIRKKGGEEAFALTFPLITTADGKKFGKSEKGAVFLDPELTSPYAFYQYFINADDRDVVDFLKYFTFLDEAEVNALAKETEERPHLRAAQKSLAREVTRIVHGDEEVAKVEAATDALFGQGDMASVDPKVLRAACESAPTVAYGADCLPDLAQMLLDMDLVKSKGQAKKDIKAGGVYVNNARIQDFAHAPAAADFIGGELLLVRKGKKNYGLVTLK